VSPRLYAEKVKTGPVALIRLIALKTMVLVHVLVHHNLIELRIVDFGTTSFG
jgi:hypothetical protein